MKCRLLYAGPTSRQRQMPLDESGASYREMRPMVALGGGREAENWQGLPCYHEK